MRIYNKGEIPPTTYKSLKNLITDFKPWFNQISNRICVPITQIRVIGTSQFELVFAMLDFNAYQKRLESDIPLNKISSFIEQELDELSEHTIKIVKFYSPNINQFIVTCNITI